MPLTNIEPVVFSPSLFINGCQVQWVSTTAVSVTTGLARDSSNTIDIPVNSTLTVSTALSGAGGIDTGTILAGQVYFVYLISDATGFLRSSALISIDKSTPTLPLGYTNFRLIGRIRTDSSSNILKFYSYANSSSDRFIQLDSPFRLVNAGTATTFTSFGTLFSSINNIASPVYLFINYTPASSASGHQLSIRPFGSSTALGSSIINIQALVGSQPHMQSMVKILPVIDPGNSDASSLEYALTSGDSVSIYITGYVDRL